MANLLDIKRRIRSVKNTQQITKAMKMVAAAKLRRGQDRILATRPYALELRQGDGEARPGRPAAAEESDFETDASKPRGGRLRRRRGVEDDAHRLARPPAAPGAAGGEGPAGGRHRRPRPGRLLQRQRAAPGAPGGGRVGRTSSCCCSAARAPTSSAAARRRSEAAHREPLHQHRPTRSPARSPTTSPTAFADGEYDAVHVVYNQFKSVMQQELTEERLLPIPIGDAAEEAAEPPAPTSPGRLPVRAVARGDPRRASCRAT